MRGLETSGITVLTYDKENIPQINRPVKKKGRPSKYQKRAESKDISISDVDNQACKQFDSMMKSSEVTKDK